MEMRRSATCMRGKRTSKVAAEAGHDHQSQLDQRASRNYQLTLQMNGARNIENYCVVVSGSSGSMRPCGVSNLYRLTPNTDFSSNAATLELDVGYGGTRRVVLGYVGIVCLTVRLAGGSDYFHGLSSSGNQVIRCNCAHS